MIGGVDIKIEIPGRAGRAALDASVRIIRSFWPSAVFENAENSDYYDRFDEIPFSRLREIFVYKDEAARDLWETEGAVPEATNLMIHLIVDDPDLFVVMDDDTTPEMQRVLAAIRTTLDDEAVRNAA